LLLPQCSFINNFEGRLTMSIVAKDTSKRLLAVHGWSGVLLGLFLYVVVVTGTVSVLAHEIGDWSISGTRDTAPFSQSIDARVTALADSVDPRFREDVAIYPNAAGSLIVFFHTHGTNNAGDPDELGVRFRWHRRRLRSCAAIKAMAWSYPAILRTL
jgi:uncharacterized iron-regulated membrane protein